MTATHTTGPFGILRPSFFGVGHWSVQKTWYDKGNFRLDYRFGDVLYQFIINASDFDNAPEARLAWLHFVRRFERLHTPKLRLQDRDNAFSEGIEALYRWAISLMRTAITILPRLDERNQYTLQHVIYPRVLRYTVIPDGKGALRPSEEIIDFDEVELVGLPPCVSDYDSYALDDIIFFPRPNAGGGENILMKRLQTVKLRWIGTTCLFIPTNPNSTGEYVLSNTRIPNNLTGDDVRLWKPSYKVIDDRTSRLVGFVFPYKQPYNQETSFLRSTLAYQAELGSKQDCEKWYRQVKATVGLLHASGVVWGNINPENVFIDQAGDACVILDSWLGMDSLTLEVYMDNNTRYSEVGDNDALEILRQKLLDDPRSMKPFRQYNVHVGHLCPANPENQELEEEITAKGEGYGEESIAAV